MLKSFILRSRFLSFIASTRSIFSMGKVKIGTHSGTFHCDEVLACSMLRHADSKYQDAEIVRSRDMKVLDECDIVVDVGGVYDPKTHRYDHHQRSFDQSMNSLNQDYPWTIKLSSAGLVYYHFGHQIISKILGLPADSESIPVLFHKIYENLIQEVDAIDNGIDPSDSEPRYKVHTHLSARVKHLNPTWNEKNPDENACFQNASKLVEQEFLDRVNFYGKVWLPARDNVKKAILNRNKVHPSEEIVEFENGGCPWKEHLFEIEENLKIEKPIKFVIYTDTLGLWRIQCVPRTLFSFENRLSLKKEWQGLRNEELSDVSGIPGCTFVHSNGFIGGNKTREGVLRMALDTLNLIK